jgi:hypothetical protein
MIEATHTTRTSAAYAKAHEERGRAIRAAFGWLFGMRGR